MHFPYFIEPLTECEQRQIIAANHNLELEDERESIYMPKCTQNGDFEKSQCWKEKCWCVDIDGNEIEGTKSSYGYPTCPKSK